jgi:DNA repair exonuclease SbcCD nuclease subunit
LASRNLRLLLLGDTHLGLPSIEHFASFERALLPALRGEVDLVVHGGDILYRSRVKPDLVLRAFAPLKRVADAGVPVVVVPGNHERSAIPFPLLAAHPGVHVVDRPRTIVLDVGGMTVSLSGFPNDRDAIREAFGALLERTGWQASTADIRLLVMHQTVEGASVGPVGFTFRSAPDVIPGRAIPAGFAAVLSGHIHRHQVLRADLRGRTLGAPVFYAGSTARTSYAERDEAKGYVIMEIAPDSRGGRVAAWTFNELSEGSAAVPAAVGAASRGAERPPQRRARRPRSERARNFDPPMPRVLADADRPYTIKGVR